MRKLCKRCGTRAVTGKSGAAKYCDLCRGLDPHRNNHRRKTEIIVHVDLESDGNGTILTASYGREDGSSGSLITSDPVAILMWYLDNLVQPWHGQKQVIQAFHFDHDTALLAKFTDTAVNMLIDVKATARHRDVICKTSECPGHCGKFHRYDRETITHVVTMGGETDVLAVEAKSRLGIAATPKRRLYIEHRPGFWNGDDRGYSFTGRRTLDIHDVGTAFVGGLEKVISDWRPELSDEEREIISWGKAHRSTNLAHEDMSMVARYSEAECVAASRCSRLLINTVHDASGIVIEPHRLFGSGSIAGSAFHYYGVPSLKETQTSEYDWLPQLTYFGGLIETPVVGLVLGELDEEDINSAYPSAMVYLPCMREGHGSWIHRKRGLAPELFGHDTVGHIQVSWHVDTPSTPPFSVRTKEGLVRQPLSGYKIWTTIPEYLAAVKQFPNDITAHEAVWWVENCDCGNPLEWLRDLYNKRLELKGQMKHVEKGSEDWWALHCRQNAIKLVINSCYGKLAQQRPHLGKYANLHYASYITGRTRAMVRSKTWDREACGGTTVYQHTDSVLSVDGGATDEGKALGAWGLEDKHTTNALIIQPGLMTGLGGGKTASRGVNENKFIEAATAWAETEDLTQPPAKWSRIQVPGTRMISRRNAIARGHPEQAGCFVDYPMEIGVSMGKRDVDAAVPMKNQPKAWMLPPVLRVPDPATIEDIKQYKTSLDRRIESGEFDE